MHYRHYVFRKLKLSEALLGKNESELSSCPSLDPVVKRISLQTSDLPFQVRVLAGALVIAYRRLLCAD